jgi:hypothetical protein
VGATGPASYVPGTTGATGPGGSTGISGATGAPGYPGATGSTGPTGATGAAGASGIGASGASGISGATGPALLRLVSAPANSNSTGIIGDISYDSTYIYICVAVNTWRRVFASTF